MNATLFQSTLPMGAPDPLMRVSAFRRYLGQEARDDDSAGANSRLSSLSPSLMQDLTRFEKTARGSGERLELLEVLAACVRHGGRLLLHLDDAGQVLPMTVFPAERLVHCPLPMAAVLDAKLPGLHVLRVEMALLRPPGHRDRALAADPADCAPLAPLLWELALRGAREDLLPEIAGMAAYRIAPGIDLAPLDIGGTLAQAVARLQRCTTNLREIADWPGFDRSRATRLLNALYLQAGLMVTRSHPAATNDGWFSGAR